MNYRYSNLTAQRRQQITRPVRIRGSPGISHQSVDLTGNHSPARPLTRVATVPGYQLQQHRWTTRNWECVNQQSVPEISPEVASVIAGIKQRSSTANLKPHAVTVSSTDSVPLIVLDEDDHVTSDQNREQSNVLTKSNDHNTSPVTATVDVTESPVLERQTVATNVESEDSTDELLKELMSDQTELLNPVGFSKSGSASLKESESPAGIGTVATFSNVLTDREETDIPEKIQRENDAAEDLSNKFFKIGADAISISSNAPVQ